MELTGKCREDFEEWVRRNQDWENYYVEWDGFFELPLSMQWGVFLDFFIDKGLSILIDSNHSGWFYEIDKTNGTYVEGVHEEKEDIHLVRKLALSKANEIYNQL